MKTVVTAHVGANGILNLTVPLSHQEACKIVRVTVETLEERTAPLLPTDRASWLRFVERTAGSITDPTFERHAQGEYEEREPLP